jgi:hypothetical protein
MKSIVVSVDYHDILAITLPANARHFEKTVVVTTPDDIKTHKIVEGVENAELFKTDVFYKFGATFNKGLALELGFNQLGRDGWIVVWDADTLFPDSIDIPDKEIGKLYGARRKVAYNEYQFNHNFMMKCADFYPDENEIPGYFQMFHAADPALKNCKYWYPVHWKHAGGCDSYFQMRWRGPDKIWADFWVIHYGDPGKNWHGRYTPFLDGTTHPDAKARQAKQDGLFINRKLNGITESEKINRGDVPKE